MKCRTGRPDLVTTSPPFACWFPSLWTGAICPERFHRLQPHPVEPHGGILRQLKPRFSIACSNIGLPPLRSATASVTSTCLTLDIKKNKFSLLSFGGTDLWKRTLLTSLMHAILNSLFLLQASAYQSGCTNC